LEILMLIPLSGAIRTPMQQGKRWKTYSVLQSWS